MGSKIEGLLAEAETGRSKRGLPPANASAANGRARASREAIRKLHEAID